MSAGSFDPQPAAEQIDAICLRLFDSWCDTRNVISLTFLLRCWPLISMDAASLRQLGTTLGELQELHGDVLAEEQADLLAELKQRIDDLQVHGPEVRAIARHNRDRAWATSKLLRLCRIEP
ncbi:hypothetical protein SBC1_36700 (plasmid) [Caballeronia sp. SBC1]|jgi:hypothetical protein|uniref:hypothetical protein n=1 Tax=unclassified Caballeronia TaxID=2646786 RepID=UPI0013E1959D|nr:MULTISPECIES: hypothetical protein [unclassified Caballeronia]QIE27054.1 hypothetical protein SBC2_51240 [Caballeronia sp. SBC2]QIN63630.1 hypothetical protein SBC1_36700 [Caballeronia sp. SBC1]